MDPSSQGKSHRESRLPYHESAFGASGIFRPLKGCSPAPIPSSCAGLFKQFTFRPGTDELKRYGLAVAAGLVLATAFPTMGLAGLAWVAAGLMLMAGVGKRGAASFRIGYMGGLAFYLGALY